MSKKPSAIERLKILIAEYGRVALGVYLALFATVLGCFYTAFLLGLPLEGASGAGGALLGSWVAAKITQPARIALTAILTPIVARYLPNRKNSPQVPQEGELEAPRDEA